MCVIDPTAESIAQTRDRLVALIENELEWMRVTVSGPRHHAYRNIRRWRMALSCLNALEGDTDSVSQAEGRSTESTLRQIA